MVLAINKSINIVMVHITSYIDIAGYWIRVEV